MNMVYHFISNLLYFWGLFFYKYIKKVKFGYRTSFLGFVHIKNGKYIKIGRNSSIGYQSWLSVITDYAGFKCKVKDGSLGIYIGDRVKITQKLKIYCAESVYIDDDVLLASEIFITDYNHGINAEVDYSAQALESSPVYIGKGAWIGEKVCILPGVEIGKRAIIAAGSIVTKNVPEYTMAAGNPAKVIKFWDDKKKEWVKICNGKDKERERQNI